MSTPKTEMVTLKIRMEADKNDAGMSTRVTKTIATQYQKASGNDACPGVRDTRGTKTDMATLEATDARSSINSVSETQ